MIPGGTIDRIQLIGDVYLEEALKVKSFIMNTPRCMGVMTLVMLIVNVLRAARRMI